MHIFFKIDEIWTKNKPIDLAYIFVFLKMTRISFDFHQIILEIQFKIMINFVQFFADEILIFSIRKIQNIGQKMF